jgi:V/A-type H+-transporting ATPase subunit D
MRVNELHNLKEQMEESLKRWVSIFCDEGVFTPDIVRITKLQLTEGNVAGVPIPIYHGAEFETAQYDLLKKPLWLDAAVDFMKKMLALDMQLHCLEEQQRRLRKELQTTSQRVNLFEKIKIPEAKTNIKKIGIYLGDQQTAAVVRGKISKRGMERAGG